MSTTYFIRGTISVQVNRGKLTPTIWVAPCAGFLTPDKQQAIAFPVPSTEKVKYAALIDKSKDNEHFEFEAEAIKEYIPGLLVFAAQQKAIEFRFAPTTDNESSLEIVGFIVPAPADNA